MEYAKITSEEIRGFDAQKSKETEDAIRKELANMRMDLYSNQASTSSNARLLKKSLARVLTVRNQMNVKSGDKK